MSDLSDKIDKQYEEQSLAEVADAPVSALQGISDSDAQHLKDAFNIKTVRDLGTNKYFLWAQSIAKLADPPDSRRIELEASVAVYLGTDDQVLQERVLTAASDLLAWLGYGRSEAYEEERGSLFARWRAKGKKVLTNEELHERLVKAERALELQYLDKAQADVDAKEAEAASKLMQSLQDVPTACLRLGSLLLVKFQAQGGPVVLTRNLSQLEIRILEKYPELQTNPSKTLEQLALAVSQDGPHSA